LSVRVSKNKHSSNSKDSEIITLAVYENLHLHDSHSMKRKKDDYHDDHDDSTQDIHDIVAAEKEVAKGMCIPVEMFGVSLGHALVDQGATRSIIRQTALTKIKVKIKIRKVYNMSVLCSDGKSVIPIIGCFVAPISSGGIPMTKALIYIASNTLEKDIVCDIVVGRASLATGLFPCIDMRKDGTIYHPNKSVSIPCIPCRFTADDSGQMQLMPIHKKNNNSISISSLTQVGTNRNDSDYQGRKDRRPRIDESESTDDNITNTDDNIIKLNVLRSIVYARDGITLGEKESLYTHLSSRVEDFDVVSKPSQKLEQHTSNEDIHQSMILYNFMCDMDRCDSGTKEEQNVVDTFLSSYVPNTVQKPEKLTQNKAEIKEYDIIDEVEEIEFPFTPPTKRESSPEYVTKKLQEIKKRVYDVVHLTDDQKQRLFTLLSTHHDRFSLSGENMERTDTVQHEIDTANHHPFRERLRQYSPAIQSIIDDEVVKMIKEGVIVPSKSAYASNLLLVRKPDPSSEGGVKNRVCASFVRLNTHTEKDSYPLPSIQYIYDKIGRSKWFTTMDLLSGFWQVLIKPEHRHKTAFLTMRGLYEFVVMPFGLCNAPATFQRLMDAVILPEYRDFIETYIDDLMTHSGSFEDHMKHLDILYKQLRTHKLVVKLNKCKFAQWEVKFLGHIISQGSLKTNPETVEAVKQWQRPSGTGKKAVSAIRGFLGTVNWYRKFIPNCADIQRPLIHLTKKDVPFEWTAECQKSFEKLRDALTSAPVLAIANPNKDYIVHSDASNVAMGAGLMQEDEHGNLRAIAYASKAFNSAQRNYDTTDREALAMVWALEHFNTYCEGHKYTLITDHQALSYLKTNKDKKKRIHRLALKLSNYDVQVYYKPGKENHLADLLSRDYMITEKVGVLPDKSSNITPLSALHVAPKSKRRVLEGQYEVDKIIDKRKVDGRDDEYEYLIKWKGCDDSENTWEPTGHLEHASKLLVDFEKKIQKNGKRVAFKESENKSPRYLPEIMKCPTCTESFPNESAFHIHNYHEHAVLMPSRITQILVNKNM
jgi:hypothetical protein